MLVLNWDDLGVGMHLQVTAPHELACYTMNDDGADDCDVCFVAWEVATGDNACRLDGATVSISAVFTPYDKNCCL